MLGSNYVALCGGEDWIIYETSKFRELPAPLLLFLFTEPDITKQLNHQFMRFGRPYSDKCVSWFYVHEGYGITKVMEFPGLN